MGYLDLKTNRALERERRALLGEDAFVVLRDKTGSDLANIQSSFMVVRKSNLTLGEEYSELEIAEKAFGTDDVQMTQEIANQVVEVLYSGVTYNASQTEDAITATRTWKFRLTPLRAKSA